jgi:hypothetical protein
MTSLTVTSSSSSSWAPLPNILPTKKEWKRFVTFLTEHLEADQKLLPEGRVIGLQECDQFYKFLSRSQFTEPTKNLHQLFFHPLATLAGFAMLSIAAEKRKLMPVTINVADTVTTYHLDIDAIRAKVLAYTNKVQPYLETLHKVTGFTIQIFKDIGIRKGDENFGFILSPEDPMVAIAYIRNEGLLFPFCSFDGSKYADTRYHKLPIFSYFGGVLPLAREIVMNPGHQINRESGYLIRVGVPDIPDATEEECRNLIELMPIRGSEGTISFASSPFSLATLAAYADNPTTRMVSMIVPLEELKPGYIEFFSFPSEPSIQKLVAIEILEAVIEISKESATSHPLIAEAQEMIVMIEEDYVETAKLEYEKKIQLEQEARQKLITSHEINQINKTGKKSNISKMPKEVKLVEKNEEKKTEEKSVLNPLKEARDQLLKGKKWVKKHKFVAYINRVKKELKHADFLGLVSQNGSHITLHGEEKESVTIVIPHKRDRTTPSKLISRFVNNVQDFFHKSFIRK